MFIVIEDSEIKRIFEPFVERFGLNEAITRIVLFNPYYNAKLLSPNQQGMLAILLMDSNPLQVGERIRKIFETQPA